MEERKAKEDEQMIAIVVPVWNEVTATAQFLKGVHHWVKKYSIQLVVVDNGSVDGTPKLLTHWKTRYGDLLRVVRNSTNRGFGPANNQGVEATEATTLVLMNNDVVIRGNFIKPVLEHLEEHPGTIGCGRLVDWDGHWNCFNNKELIVTYAEGWLLAMRRRVWRLLGGFDERYVPCDYEDMDLSMVAHLLKIELRQLELPLQHQSGTSTRQLGDREKITLRHRKVFMEKWGLKD